MCDAADDLLRALTDAQADSHVSSREEADSFHQSVNRLCSAQWLAHNRHCRRIYRTLCEFCKPADVVLELRQTTNDLWRTWKAIQSTCGGTLAEMLSRLTDAKLVEKDNYEKDTIILLLSLLKSDMNEAGDSLSLMERGLQQLRNDVERESALTLDAASQRRALRKRRIQRLVAVQLGQENISRLLEEESHRISELKLKSSELQANMEGQLAQQMTVSSSLKVGHDSQTCSYELNPALLRQLGLDIKAHEMAQAALLSKTHQVLNHLVQTADFQMMPSVVQSHKTQASGKGGLMEALTPRLTHSVNASLLARAECLLNRSWEEGMGMDECYAVGTNSEHRTRNDDYSTAALEDHASKLQRQAAVSISSAARAHRISGASKEILQRGNNGRETALRAECGAGAQLILKQKNEVARIPLQSHVGGSHGTVVLSSGGRSSLLDCSIKEGSSIPVIDATRLTPKEMGGMKTRHGADNESLQLTPPDDPVVTAVLVSSESEFQEADVTPQPSGGEFLPLVLKEAGNSVNPRLSRSSILHHEAQKLNVTRSKALVLARIRKLARVTDGTPSLLSHYTADKK
ncbi:hypothetical protein DQ04_05841010 [Trypanosoma grayi]|uniref:hypothetical protein n=1 Tax=Trypanosoma grayi TaxID=71804 RepID=UPI0004F4BCE9|nr:hypothetical protein DQ04_05841010 [Trypanosoma grayi]KEG09090.1 hypothetical protein DQ04_05841010 [Trypanosoma grayi]